MFKLCVIFLVFAIVNSKSEFEDYADELEFELNNTGYDAKSTLKHAEQDVNDAMDDIESLSIKKQEAEIRNPTHKKELSRTETQSEIIRYLFGKLYFKNQVGRAV